MYLDLIDVVREPGNLSEKSIDIEARLVDDIDFVEPILGSIKATNARRNIVISGRAHTAVAMECARCLRTYAQSLDLDLEAVAPTSFFGGAVAGVPTRDGDEDKDIELSEEELATLFEGHSLDVLELIRQAVVLQSPRKPLCSVDCTGLPEASQYIATPDDARWGALKDWKDNHGPA